LLKLNIKSMSNEIITTVTTESVTVKLGRPIVPGSARQEKLARLAEKAARGEEIKRGRPTNPNSARQERLMKQAARKAAGIEVKLGRPKMIKPEEAKQEVKIGSIEFSFDEFVNNNA
jgi:hypothetical protein